MRYVPVIVAALAACTGARPSPTPSAAKSERGVVSCGKAELDYERGCHADDDCALAFVALDCCGSQAAVGVSNGDQERMPRQPHPPRQR